MDEIQLISDFCLFFSFPSVEDFMTVILSRSRLVPELIPLSSVVLSSRLQSQQTLSKEESCCQAEGEWMLTS